MKFWCSDYIFHSPWEDVAKAAIRKWPNPLNQSVEAIDVVERKIGSDGILCTHRLISSQWGIPGRWLGGPTIMYANERSEVDVKRKKMVLRTRNISFCKVIAVDETLWYEACKDNPKTVTKLRQEAIILVQGLPLTHTLENLLVSSMSDNAKKGRQAMEWILAKIKKESSSNSNIDDNKGKN